MPSINLFHRVEIEIDEGFVLERSKTDTKSSEKYLVRSLYSPFGDGQLMGRIRVQPSAQFNLVEAKYSARSNAITSVSLIGVTALITLLVVRANISNPLEKLSATLHAIESGEQQRLPLPKKNENDELGLLIKDINNLLEVLDRKFNEERALRKRIETIEQSLRLTLDSTSAGLFLLDEQGKLLTFNSTLKNILKISETGDNATLHPSIANFFNEKQEFNGFLKKVLDSKRMENRDFSLTGADQATVWVHCLMSKVIDSSGKTNVEGVLFDITSRVNNEQSIKYEADHDPLTGLLRRNAVQTAFESYVDHCKEPNACCFLMDLDGFKQVNDIYGHIAGDKVLVISAERLTSCVRSSDLVARLGGDEFLIILINSHEQEVALKIAEKIVKAIQKPMPVNENTVVNVGISLGIATPVYKEQSFESLIETADEAMYAVKRKGKNGYCFNNAGDLTVKLIRPEPSDSDLTDMK